MEATQILTGKITIDGIDMEPYSAKSFTLRGEATRAKKEQLKALGGKWNSRLKGGAGWIFPNTKLVQVKEFLEGPAPSTGIFQSLNQMFALQLDLARSPGDRVQASDATGKPVIVDRAWFNQTLGAIYQQIGQLSTQSTSGILNSLNQMFTLQWHLAKSPNDQIQANDAAGNPTIVDRTQFNQTLESIYNQIRRLSGQPGESRSILAQPEESKSIPAQPVGPIFSYAYYQRGCSYLLAIDNDPVKLLNLLRRDAHIMGDRHYDAGIIKITPGEPIFCEDEDVIFNLEPTEDAGQIETRGNLKVSQAPTGNLSVILYILRDDSEEAVVVFEREDEATVYIEKIHEKLKGEILEEYGDYDYEEIPIRRYQLGTIDPGLGKEHILDYEESKAVDINQYLGII